MIDPGDSHTPDWIRAALEKHEGPLLRYAQRITGDADRARDVVQETFLRLCRRRQGELDGHLVEWLYTVCRNQALDVRRKEQRMAIMARSEAGVLVNSNGREPQPDRLAEDRDTLTRVLHLIQQLPDNQQTVLRLKFQHGLSYREIAEATGLSSSNVGYLIHVGLRTLRRKLA